MTIDNALAVMDEDSTVMSIIARAAADPNTDVVKLEKLMDMQERILNRNAAQAFSAAFARMQAELPEITENGSIKVNGDVRSRYGLFEDINEAIKPSLKQHGFAISFRIKQEATNIRITAVLSHEQGHSEETEMVLPSDASGAKNPVQAIGSSVSYGKRYTMCALLNITTRGQDDNGAIATALITTEQAVEIDLFIPKCCKDVKVFKPKFLDYMAVDDVRKIRACDHKKAMTLLDSKFKQKGADNAVA